MEIVLASSDEVYTTDKTWYKQLKQHICLSMIFMGQNRGNTVKIPLSFLFLSNTIIPTFKIVLPRYRWNTAKNLLKLASINKPIFLFIVYKKKRSSNTNGTLLVTLVTNSVIIHEWVQDRMVIIVWRCNSIRYHCPGISVWMQLYWSYLSNRRLCLVYSV